MAQRSDAKSHLKARLRGRELTDALSDRQLNGLWMHTFTPLERWTLFWKAPVVLYLVNVLLSWFYTIIFTEYFVRSSPRLEPATAPSMSSSMPASSTTVVDIVEIVIMVYHISAIFRELLQVMPIKEITSTSIGWRWYQIKTIV